MRHQKHCNTHARSRSRFSQPFQATFHKRDTGRLSRWSAKMLSGLALLAVSVGLLASARADDHIRAVRISNVVGSVQVLNGTESQFSQAYMNMPLLQGSTLRTGDDGRAEVQFEDGSVVRLTPNTSVEMAVLSRSAEGNTNTEVDLLTGLTYVEMRGTANQRLLVHFGPNEVISPAPVKFRVNLDSNPSEFAVLDGSAHLANGSSYSVDVHQNETVRFDATDQARYFLAQGLDPESWDQWSNDRDQAMNQMAARETREARGSSNPNDPSWSDLDYYGNWYSANGSSVWAPTGVGAGWDPYGSGYWGFYGGAGGGGYSWISGYPWGWLPYHCGLWNYYNAFGWGWTPGSCGSIWSPYGGIGYAPAGYKHLPYPTTPHPMPAHHSGHLGGGQLIAVNRGPEATKIVPQAVAAGAVNLGGQAARLMAKTPGSSALAPRGEGATNVRLAVAPRGLGGPSTGMPAFRPIAPVSNFRTSAPIAASAHSFAAAPSPSVGHASAPSAGLSSAGASHASGGGGGHVK